MNYKFSFINFHLFPATVAAWKYFGEAGFCNSQHHHQTGGEMVFCFLSKASSLKDGLQLPIFSNNNLIVVGKTYLLQYLLITL